MRAELIGYADKFTVVPGEPMRFMVSTDQAQYEAVIVRLIHADENPAGPAFKEEVMASTGLWAQANGLYWLLRNCRGQRGTQADDLPYSPGVDLSYDLPQKRSAGDHYQVVKSRWCLYIGENGKHGLVNWLTLISPVKRGIEQLYSQQSHSV
jgi:hypothetical protein